jgi:hypothetical protein
LADLAVSCGAHTVILDVSRCLEATTPALARFVLLRRELLGMGRDFRIAGLRGQPAKLIEVHRLEKVLPCLSEVPSRSTAPMFGEPSDSHYADNAALLCLQ